MIYMWQFGLGLFDCEYYFKDDEVLKDICDVYIKYIECMFMLVKFDVFVDNV